MYPDRKNIDQKYNSITYIALTKTHNLTIALKTGNSKAKRI